MNKKYQQINHIPSIIWGKQSDAVYLYIHGQGGRKEDASTIAEAVENFGWQVLSIDLANHGDRLNDEESFVPWKVQLELMEIMNYVKCHWNRVVLCANSIGAYFSLLSFSNESFEKALFISPILDMKQLIATMMTQANVTEFDLEQQQIITTPFGQTLSWQYWSYVLEHPITKWAVPTSILYGEKDALVPFDIIETFSHIHNCNIKVMKNGEHWFHTKEQLNVLRSWAKQVESNTVCAKEKYYIHRNID